MTVVQPGGPLAWLDYCGIEVANAARVVEYLRAGLGGSANGHWDVGTGDVCGVLYRTTSSGGCYGCGIYGAGLYGLGGGGGCIGAARGIYVSPSADPAPWYDVNEPGSATFLGVVLLDMSGWDSTIARTVTDRTAGLQGGTFGSQRRQPRVWKFKAALISADDAGAEYGLRWLTNTLKSSECSVCDSCHLSVRLTCPPSDCSHDARGLWSSYEVALTDGPHETETWSPAGQSMSGIFAGCRDFVVVEWTLVAGNPWKYSPLESIFTQTVAGRSDCTDICEFLFGSAADAHCAAVSAPTRGVLGAIFEIQTDAVAMGSVTMSAYSSCGGSSGPTGLLKQLQVSGVPAHSTLTVDSAKHSVTLETRDAVTNAVLSTTDARNLLVLAAGRGIEWLEVRDCDDDVCLCVGPAEPCTAGTSVVSLFTQLRED